MRYGYDAYFEKKLREIAACGSVLDVGGGERFGKELACYRDLFRGVEYRTLDLDPRYHPDIQASVYKIPLPNGSVGAVICKSVLEHLEEPGQAVDEMYRILKPGGRLLAYAPFIYPYHARPGGYRDYYRFAEDALRYLFRRFHALEVVKVGGYFRALMFFVPFQARLKPVLEPVAYALDRITRRDRGSTTAGYHVYAVK